MLYYEEESCHVNLCVHPAGHGSSMGTNVIKRNTSVKASKGSTAMNWDHVSDFSEGMAKVGVNSYKEGFVDKTGKVVTM